MLDPHTDPHVCLTCGAHVPGDATPPALCPICDEPRQYVKASGQAWGRHDGLLADHAPRIEPEAFGLMGVGLEPEVAIGQRALLVRTPEGNVLWDCVPLLHEATVERLLELGGVRAVAVSHPHFYTGAARFAEAFGADVFLHAADRSFVTHPHPSLRFWDGERQSLFGGVELVREVERIGAALEPLAFDGIVGGWWGRVVERNGTEVVRRSVVRYREALEDRLDGAEVPWPVTDDA